MLRRANILCLREMHLCQISFLSNVHTQRVASKVVNPIDVEA